MFPYLLRTTLPAPARGLGEPHARYRRCVRWQGKLWTYLHGSLINTASRCCSLAHPCEAVVMRSVVHAEDRVEHRHCGCYSCQELPISEGLRLQHHAPKPGVDVWVRDGLFAALRSCPPEISGDPQFVSCGRMGCFTVDPRSTRLLWALAHPYLQRRTKNVRTVDVWITLHTRVIRTWRRGLLRHEIMGISCT